ncbi:MAG: fumarylacetoacetate hydrolase family protein [Cyclobacteriaceae bacterium]
MKLIRFGKEGKERTGVLLENGIAADVSSHFPDFDEKFFSEGGIAKLRKIVSEKLFSEVHPERIGPPLARPSKIICIGLNYRNHALESKMAIPEEPIIFLKSTTAITGPNDPIIIPKGSTKTDWEVELAVVIGRRASYINASDALNYVAGYMLHNDVSERAFQLERGGQWVKGKSCDSFAPIGPWLVTTDEISNPNNLRMWLTLNDEKVQDENTSDMIFHVPFLISYISQFMTLLPGDIISTGTPSGVGLALGRYLKPGDVVELGIEGLGTARQEVIQFTGV